LTTHGSADGGGLANGRVVFKDGTLIVGSANLNSANEASLSTAFALGDHSLTASYRGDSIFASSDSAVVIMTVHGTPDFAIGLPAPALVVERAGTATTTVTIASENGFIGTVTLSCSDLPVDTTCSFSPASVTAGATPVNSTLTIRTGAKGIIASQDHAPSLGRMVVLACGVLPLTCLFRWRRWALALGLLAIAALGGCGSSPKTPEGTAKITITATANGISHQQALQLMVQ
jgi:Big-like domain-containing protein